MMKIKTGTEAPVVFASGPVRRGRHSVSRKSIAGQAMVLFVVLIGVLCLGMLLLFNTGQAVNKKVQLTNAADAAAYSVAVQQARAMNWAAYMNRGRIANEVAVAQMVSLWSWSNMIHTHMIEGYNVIDPFAKALGAVPILGQILVALSAIYKAAEIAAGAMREIIHPAATLAITGLDLLNGLMATSANLMLRSGSLGAGWQIADEIVKANDPTASLSVMGAALLQQQLMHAGSSTNNGMLEDFKTTARNDGMDRFRNVVMGSRDHFSADRRDDTNLIMVKFKGRGGTDMVDYNRWVGMDTLDLSIKVLFVIDLDVPLGWGAAQAAPNRNGAFFPGIKSAGANRRNNGWYSEFHSRNYGQYGGVTRNLSGRNAEQYPSVNFPFPQRPFGTHNKKQDAYFTGYRQGLRNYDDINPATTYGDVAEDAGNKKAGPIFSVFVESDAVNARTAEDVDIGGAPGSRFELKHGMNNNKMTAISTAQVYFNRPPAHDLFKRIVPRGWNQDPVADNQLEMGSLFSPYWQARLVETPRDIYAKVGLVSIVTGGT